MYACMHVANIHEQSMQTTSLCEDQSISRIFILPDTACPELQIVSLENAHTLGKKQSNEQSQISWPYSQKEPMRLQDC